MATATVAVKALTKGQIAKLNAEHELCNRCGGTGRMPFSVANGVCFRCAGAKHDPTACKPCRITSNVAAMAFVAGKEFGAEYLEKNNEAHIAAFEAFHAAVQWPAAAPRMKSVRDSFNRGASEARMLARIVRCEVCRLQFASGGGHEAEVAMLSEHTAAVHGTAA